MNSPAHDTAIFLVAEGLAVSFGGADAWSVYVGREPIAGAGDPLESVVTVYDTGGGPGPLIDLRRPTVQVRVRSASYGDGWMRANVINAALVAPVGVDAPGVAAAWWAPTSDVAFIGRDDRDRPIFTANYEMTRDGAAI